MTPESQFVIKSLAVMGRAWCRILVSVQGRDRKRRNKWFDVSGPEARSLALALEAVDEAFIRDSRDGTLSIPAQGSLYVESVGGLRILEEEDFPHRGIFVAAGVMRT